MSLTSTELNDMVHQLDMIKDAIAKEENLEFVVTLKDQITKTFSIACARYVDLTRSN